MPGPNGLESPGNCRHRSSVRKGAVSTSRDANLATPLGAFTAQTTKIPCLQSFKKRMKGLEPSTFCMANASGRSLPFAPVRSNRLFAGLGFRPRERSQPHPSEGRTLPSLPRTRGLADDRLAAAAAAPIAAATCAAVEQTQRGSGLVRGPRSRRSGRSSPLFVSTCSRAGVRRGRGVLPFRHVDDDATA
jgi:hypothetical protein